MDSSFVFHLHLLVNSMNDENKGSILDDITKKEIADYLE